VVSAPGSPGSVRSPTQAACPSGRISTAAGAVTAPSTGSSHLPAYVASTSCTRAAHGVMSKPRLTEVEQHGPGVVQQGEHAKRAVGGDQVQIGHAAPEQRVSLTEVVMNVQARHHPGEPFARLVHAQQLGDDVAQRIGALAGAAQHVLHQGVALYAGTDRVPLGVVGVQEAVR
jgi:hypothetical protein